MGEYALLTEVYGSNFPKKSKKMKKKLKKEERNRIIEPNEMDRVLLDEQSTSPEVKVRNLTVDPHDEQDDSYEEYFKNPNVQRYEDYKPAESIYQRNISPNTLSNDPEYREFVEYKRNKRLESEMNKIESERKIQPSFKYSQNDQLNELMLYIFTGFFFLMLFDNIYKLGKKSY